MNNYQRNNEEWFNELKDQVEQLKNDNWASLDIQKFMQCVVCGEKTITKPTMQFYSYEPTKFKCYKCQTTKRNY